MNIEFRGFRTATLLKAILVSVALLAVTPSVSTAASFEVVEEEVFGNWSALLLRNTKGNRLFCALEAAHGDTVFRINQYKGSGDTFLEIFDAGWTMMEGEVSFALEFTGGERDLNVGMRGKSWGDSYTHDILDAQMFAVMMGLIATSDHMTVVNSNGMPLAEYGLQGSGKATAAFADCITS